MIGRPSEEYCNGLIHVPLPAPRDLWDWDNKEAWAFRYKRYISAGRCERVLTIHDLKMSPYRNTDEGLARDLAGWCENTDEFGTLLWVAVSQE